MDDDRDRIEVTRVRRGSGGLAQVALVLAMAAIAVSIIKPWESRDGGRTADRSAEPAAVTSGSPTPARVTPPSAPPASASTAGERPATSLDPLAVPCISRNGWRVVAVQRTAGRESRSWAAVVPVEARRPTDRTIPVLREVTAVTRALGYCLPHDLADESDPVDLSTDVWRVDVARARATPLRDLGRLAAPDPMASELFLAPGAETLETSRWPAGRYVFRVANRADDWALWFSVELVRATGPAGG